MINNEKWRVELISKALIVYGTRSGATASTSKEIGKIFQEQGIETTIIDAKKERIQDINPYNLVVVGSGIQVNRWTGEPEKFLGTFRKQLGSKKVALFVCCGTASSNKPDEINKMRNKYLEEKAVNYGLKPVALGFFGGVINYNTTPWWAKRVVEADRPRIEATYPPSAPGIYDLRDWSVINNWAKELAQKTLADT